MSAEPHITGSVAFVAVAVVGELSRKSMLTMEPRPVVNRGSVGASDSPAGPIRTADSCTN